VLFQNLDRPALDMILASAMRYRAPAATSVFRQGEDSKRLYLVEEGRLRMTRLSPEGGQLTIGIMNPGEVAGCVAVFRKIPYPATATALEDLTALSWTRTQLDQMSKELPLLAKNALQMIGERAELFLGRLQELTNEYSNQRLARALLRMVERSGEATEPKTIATTRQELAEFSGITLHTASRVIAEWERRGIVKGGRQRVSVLQINTLRAIAQNKKVR
jgi:CRP-like cAMP-binding protein